MTLLEFMKSLISDNNFKGFRELCEHMVLVEDELFKSGCSLAYPELIDELLDYAFTKPTSFEIIRALIELDASTEISAARLLNPFVIIHNRWVDGLLQMGIRLTPALRQSKEYRDLPQNHKNYLDAKHQLHELIQAMQTPLSKSKRSNLTRETSIKEKLLQLAHSSIDVLSEFVNAIVSLQNENPFSAEQWSEFKVAVRALPGEYTKKINAEQFKNYIYPVDPQQKPLPPATNLPYELTLAITARAQEITTKLKAQVSDDEELAILTWYFSFFNKSTLTTPILKKIQQARAILARYNSTFEQYVWNSEELLASHELNDEQRTEAVTQLSALCGKLMSERTRRSQSTNASQNTTPLPFLKPRRPKLPLLSVKLSEFTDPVAFESFVSKIRVLEAGLRAQQIEINLGILHVNDFMLNAVSKTYTGMVAHFLSKGADVNAKRNGKTALMIAASQNDFETCTLLACHSEMRPNEVDDEKMTALMLALRNKKTKTAEFLLDLEGVDVNLQNTNGEDALILAVCSGVGKECVKHLLLHSEISAIPANSLKEIYFTIQPDVLQLILITFDYDLDFLYELYDDVIERSNNHTMKDYYLPVRMALAAGIVNRVLQDPILLLKQLFKPHFPEQLAAYITAEHTDPLLSNKALAADLILRVKSEINNRKGILFAVRDSEIIEKLKHILTLDAKLLNDYVEMMMIDKDKNPFDVQQWKRFTDLLTAALKDYKEYSAMWASLQNKIEKFTHPAQLSFGSLNDVIDASNSNKLLRGASSSSCGSPVASPRDKSSAELVKGSRNGNSDPIENQTAEKPFIMLSPRATRSPRRLLTGQSSLAKISAKFGLMPEPPNDDTKNSAQNGLDTNLNL